MSNIPEAVPEDMKCDVCTGRKIKAIKYCLVCLASYCQIHVKPHYESEAFKRHNLVDPSSYVQQICSQHNKPLDIYCHDDQECICLDCMWKEHSGHKTASAANEMTLTKEEIKNRTNHFIQQIKDMERNAQEFEKALKVHKDSAQAAVEHSDRVFSELINSIKRKQTEVGEVIRAQEMKETTKVQDYIEKLKQEKSNLQEKKDKLELLLQTQDHIYFFKNYLSSAGLHIYKIQRTVTNRVSFEKVEESVAALKRKLDEDCKEHMGRISKKVADVHLSKITGIRCVVPVPCSYVQSSSSESESDDGLKRVDAAGDVDVYNDSTSESSTSDI